MAPSAAAKSGVWAPIIVALISSVTTIVVSFIAIVPQLRADDQKVISSLQRDLKARGETTDGPGTTEEQGVFSLSGTAYEKPDAQTPLPNVELYLLPAGHGELVTTTDDNGNFSFTGVPERRAFWVLVRNVNTTTKASSKVQIDTAKAENKVETANAYLSYRISN